MPALTNHETQACDLLQNILKVDGPFTAELLSGGLSGSTLIKVITPTQPYVMRFWNMQWIEYFPQDLACQLIASATGYGPHVFFTDELSCITVMEYLHPEALPHAQIKLQALANLIKGIHAGPTMPQGIAKDKDLDDSIEMIAKLNPQFLDLNIIREIINTVYTATLPIAHCVPCHRDLHPGNLIYTQSRFFAIDYTWAGMDDPYIDIATLAIFHCKTKEEEKLLLEFYLGYTPKPIDIAHLTLIKLLTQIFYALEFFKLIPTEAFDNKMPIVKPRCYINFGQHKATSLNPSDYFDYAISLISEVFHDSHSKYYIEALDLLKKSS